jgi:hypothetical protein
MSLRRRSAALAAVVGAIAIATGAVLGGLGVSGITADAAGTPAAHIASQKPFSARLSYNETNHGRQHGAATTGIQGHGSFSAKLTARGALAAALISLATGVPVSKIAQGGTYAVQRQIAGNGDVSGLTVVRFKSHGLGTTCLSYTAKPGKFVPGMSFVPMTGTIKTLGGTGAGATWRLKASFKETSVTGSAIESLGTSGSEQVSTGRPKAMTAACKRVAKLR